jgi:hypothetical protein
MAKQYSIAEAAVALGMDIAKLDDLIKRNLIPATVRAGRIVLSAYAVKVAQRTDWSEYNALV